MCCKEEMCGSVCAKSSSCAPQLVAKILLVIGGLNWGVVGASALLNGKSWNLVHQFLGAMPQVELVLYVAVGVSAVAYLVGCQSSKCCKKDNSSCAGGSCSQNNNTTNM